METVARSTAWLAAAEANQRNASGYFKRGSLEAGPWFDQGDWTARKPIAIAADSVAGPVTDFPVAVEIVDADIQATAQACGCDVVFTDADGVTRLDHMVEAYDPGTGTLTAWVSVPALSGTEPTELFVYFGNPTAVDQQDPAAVFGPSADLQITGAS